MDTTLAAILDIMGKDFTIGFLFGIMVGVLIGILYFRGFYKDLVQNHHIETQRNAQNHKDEIERMMKFYEYQIERTHRDNLSDTIRKAWNDKS